MTEHDKIKQEMMELVLQGIFSTLMGNKDKFSGDQAIADVLFSVLVMTNREVLTRIIHGSKAHLHTKRILKDFFRMVESEVRKRLNEVRSELDKGIH